MTWAPFLASLAVGAGVGVLYGLLDVRAPAPPIVALVGLLGMLLGEELVRHVRGHSGAAAQITHAKNFAPDALAKRGCAAARHHKRPGESPRVRFRD